MFVGDVGVQISIPAAINKGGTLTALTGYTVSMQGKDRLSNIKVFPATIGSTTLTDQAGSVIATAGFWAYYVTQTGDIETSGSWQFQLVITGGSPVIDIASTIITIPVLARVNQAS